MEPSKPSSEMARVERMVTSIADDLHRHIAMAVVLPPAFALLATLFLPMFAPSDDLLDDDEMARAVTLWQLAGNPAGVDGSGPATTVAKVLVLVLVTAAVSALCVVATREATTGRRLSYVAEIAAALGALGLVIVAAFAGANTVGTLTGLEYDGRPTLWLGVLAAIWCAVAAHRSRSV